MVNLTLCRLCPTAPIHLGERGIGMEETSEVIHSDSLFGALSCAWSTLHGDDELEALIEEGVRRKPSGHGVCRGMELFHEAGRARMSDIGG